MCIRFLHPQFLYICSVFIHINNIIIISRSIALHGSWFAGSRHVRPLAELATTTQTYTNVHLDQQKISIVSIVII